MRIDTKGWKEFMVTDLFYAVNTHSILRKDIEPDSGSDPYVTASNINNAVDTYINYDMSQIEAGNAVFIGGKTMVVTYQESPFFSNDSHNLALYLKNEEMRKHKYVLLYFVAVIRSKLSQKYQWSDSISGKAILKDSIIVPVSSSGEPDWDYMEEYMHCIERAAEGNLSTLRKSKTERKRVDTDTWKEFGVTELFDLSLPKGDIQVKGLDDGNVPLITPSNTNNGLIQYIAEDSKSTLYAAGSLTVDMFGNAYYQDQDFFVTAHGHVNVLLPKNPISPFAGLFVCSSIKSMFLQKYGFKDMCTQKVLKVAKISLPVTPSGKPDWEYMERYMKALECKAKYNFASVNYSVTSCRASCFNHYRLADTLPCC